METPPPPPQNMVNRWSVRILLECNLVKLLHLFPSAGVVLWNNYIETREGPAEIISVDYGTLIKLLYLFPGTGIELWFPYSHLEHLCKIPFHNNFSNFKE